ncbi:MAG: LON peptidase substrate-binding domain-containing protein [Bacteroidota bacterium]
MSFPQPLPIFPLGLVLYPHIKVPLHIFEERYKAMIAYCREADSPFGLVLFNEGRMEQVGSTARVVRIIEEYDDGRLDIIVQGEQRFTIDELHHDKAYLQARVTVIDEPADGNVDLGQKERAITQHMKLLELAGRTVRPSIYESVPFVSYVLAENAGLNPEQKQRLLELRSEGERIGFLISHFEELIPRVEQIEDVRRKVRSNGHFKDFPPESL